MKVNEAVLTASKEKDYIVYLKGNDNVVYVGSDQTKAEETYAIYKQKGKRPNILRPLAKHTISNEKVNEYLNSPSLFSL